MKIYEIKRIWFLYNTIFKKLEEIGAYMWTYQIWSFLSLSQISISDHSVTNLCYVIFLNHANGKWRLCLYCRLSTNGDCHVIHKGYISECVAAFFSIAVFKETERKISKLFKIRFWKVGCLKRGAYHIDNCRTNRVLRPTTSRLS